MTFPALKGAVARLGFDVGALAAVGFVTPASRTSVKVDFHRGANVARCSAQAYVPPFIRAGLHPAAPYSSAD